MNRLSFNTIAVICRAHMVIVVTRITRAPMTPDDLKTNGV